MGFLSRGLELLIALYFFVHIWISVLYDSQAVLPESWFSESLKATNAEYIENFHDPLMTPPFKPWFHSLVWIEILVQFPYFFLGLYAFIARRNWIRIPSIIYATTVLSTMVPIYAELIDHDDPSFAKLPVLAIYSPFVIFPILILLKTIWSPYPFGRHSNRGALLDGGLRAKYQ